MATWRGRKHQVEQQQFFPGPDIVEQHERTPDHTVGTLHQMILLGLVAISTCLAFLLKSYRNNQTVFLLILKEKLRQLALSQKNVTPGVQTVAGDLLRFAENQNLVDANFCTQTEIFNLNLSSPNSVTLGLAKKCYFNPQNTKTRFFFLFFFFLKCLFEGSQVILMKITTLPTDLSCPMRSKRL